MDPRDKPQLRSFVCWYTNFSYNRYIINTSSPDHSQAALQFDTVARGLGWPTCYAVSVRELELDDTLGPRHEFDIAVTVKCREIVEKPRGKKRQAQ
jgi:hypothetical protein